jgi:hypothetical protein
MLFKIFIFAVVFLLILLLFRTLMDNGSSLPVDMFAAFGWSLWTQFFPTLRIFKV